MDRRRVRPRSATARSACPVRRADLLLLALVAVAAVAALPAVGALLVTSIFVVPAAIARLFARDVREPARRARSRWPPASAWLGLYVSLWLDVPPGPCGGGAGRAAVRRLRAPRTGARNRRPGARVMAPAAVTAEGLALSATGAIPCSSISTSRRPRARRSACSGQTAAERPRSSERSWASCARWPGASRWTGGRPTWRRPSARVWTSPSRRSTWPSWAPWRVGAGGCPPRRADREAASGGARQGGARAGRRT